jgi:DNA-binding CsgD family transcriptional regulator
MSGQLDIRVGPNGQWREGLFTLTPREAEVLQLAADGLTNEEIAEKLWISYHTVRHHVKSVIRKLAAKNQQHAVAICLREGHIS